MCAFSVIKQNGIFSRELAKHKQGIWLAKLAAESRAKVEPAPLTKWL
jgi:hypothetical protein